MSNTNEHTKAEDALLFDLNRSVVEIHSVEGEIHLFAWRVVEDSRGTPSQITTDALELAPHQAIELARRLLNAAASKGAQ